MAATAILTRDEYHLRIRQNVDALKARLRAWPKSESESVQDRVRRYFIGRSIQIGEACFRVSDLQMPLFALGRVLCEDFFLLYWTSLSEANAEEYRKSTLSEMAKMLRFNLRNKHARVRETASKKDATEEFLPKISEHIMTKKTITDIADESGLGKVFDIVYRYFCLEVHGNTFGLDETESDMDGIAVAASAVNALLRVILLVVDNKDRIVTAEEVLGTLNMQRIPGT
jgi:Family of unknown function (DUF5677)